MTTDDLPVPLHDVGPQPERKASDGDRDLAVDVLRDAAGDGRLTSTELEQRVERALTARTTGELSSLMADLTNVDDLVFGSTPKAKDVVQIRCEGANAERVGRWTVPRRMQIHAVGGTVRLDLTEAVVTSPRLRIEAEVIGGRLVLVTRPGIEVDADALAVHGGKVRVRHDHDGISSVELTVEVSGEMRGGNLVARRPRRSVAQWVLRRGVQYPSLGA
jgi:hypothetical protein